MNLEKMSFKSSKKVYRCNSMSDDRKIEEKGNSIIFND